MTRSQRGNGSESRSLICSLTTMPCGISPCASRMTAASGSPFEDEVAVILEQLRHLRRGDADEPDLDAARAHPVGPRGFVLVIDQRRQHERDVAVHQLAARPRHLVAGARQDGGDVRHVDARHVVELLLQIRHDRRHARKRIEPRSVAADDGVLADEPAIRFQVCENHSHRPPQSVNMIRLSPPRCLDGSPIDVAERGARW